jgi:hypothetical protein
VKKPRVAKEALRTVRAAAAPAVEVTRSAVRVVFKEIKAVRKASAKALRKSRSS